MQALTSAFHRGVAPEFGIPNGQVGSELPGCGQNAARVVVVDSHDDNRDLYAQSLTWFGFHVTACSTAEDAQLTIDRELPDAIVVSVRLAGKDGFTLCESLKASPRTAGIPLIALTTGANDHKRAMESGTFAAVTMLPCLPSALFQLLQKALVPTRRPRTAHAAA